MDIIMFSFLIQLIIILPILAHGVYSNTKPKNMLIIQSLKSILNRLKNCSTKVPSVKTEESYCDPCSLKNEPAEIIISSFSSLNCIAPVNFKTESQITDQVDNGQVSEIVPRKPYWPRFIGSLSLKMALIAQNAFSFVTETKLREDHPQILNSKNVKEDFFDFYTEQIKIRRIRRQSSYVKKVEFFDGQQILLVNPLISTQMRELILKKLVYVSRKIKMQRNSSVLEIVYENPYLENLF